MQDRLNQETLASEHGEGEKGKEGEHRVKLGYHGGSGKSDNGNMYICLGTFQKKCVWVKIRQEIISVFSYSCYRSNSVFQGGIFPQRTS